MKKGKHLVLLSLLAIFFIAYLYSQHINKVVANDEDVVDVVEVLKNDYGEVSIKQTDDHLILFYRLNESTQERRFYFSCMPRMQLKTICLLLTLLRNTKNIQMRSNRNTWTSDKSKAKHFVSGNRYEIGEEDFVESAAAKGQMIVAGLEVGEYVLEEVKAPENAEMIADQTTTLFTIISGSQMPVAKTVKMIRLK